MAYIIIDDNGSQVCVRVFFSILQHRFVSKVCAMYVCSSLQVQSAGYASLLNPKFCPRRACFPEGVSSPFIANRTFKIYFILLDVTRGTTDRQ